MQSKSSVSRYVKWGAFGALVLIGLVTLLTSMVSVDTGKVGVVTQYGQVTGREIDNGLAWITPWGVQDVTVYDVKTQKVEATVPASTKDLQDVNATIVLTYNLNRGKVSEVHREVGKNFQAIEIDPQVQEAFKAVSAKYTASELITNRAEVKAEVVKNLKDRVEKNNRYDIQDVAITNFAFSAAFNQAIEAVQIANQKVAQAQQEAAQAKIDAEKTVTQAQAQADAYRLQQQALTPELLQKQAIEKWDGKLPVYSTGGNTFFNLPVGK